MSVQPYLFFDGRCEEALAFYERTLGAKQQMLLRWRDCPDPAMSAPGDDPEKIMHAQFQVGDAMVLASDGRCQGQPKFEGFALSLMVPDETEAEQAFNALAEGGQIHMPMTETFFSARFGMVADRFGVSWMVYVAP